MKAHATPTNIQIYEAIKKSFSSLQIKQENCWIRQKLEGLNISESKTFWKNYKRTIVGDAQDFMGTLEDTGILYVT